MRRLALVTLLLSACMTETDDLPDRSKFVEEGTVERGQALSSACPPYSSPADGPVQGIDISLYQTVNDWSKVAATEKFVIIKATQGSSSVDPSFASHRAGAKGQGMVVGYYHYLTFTSSGSAQADNFISAVGKLEPGELPPMLDVEDSKNAPNNSTAENIKTVADWLDKVEQALGRKPMIYTGNGFWGGPNFGNPAQFASYTFCWARYSQSNACPQVPDNLVSQVKFWQYRADAFPGIPAGQTSGINGAVDQDVFYGDMAAFSAFVGGSVGGPKYAAKYSKQSYPLASQGAAEVKVGEKVTGYFEMKNTGTEPWKPGVVFLAPIPRDQASPYAADSWVSPTRVSTVDAEVKPGEVGRFNLDISGQTTGEGSLKLGWVAEGITWFADGPLGGGPEDGVAEVKVKVLPADMGTAGAGGAGGESGASGQAGQAGETGAAGKGGGSGQGGSDSAGAGGTGAAGKGGTAGKGGAAGKGGSSGKGGSAGKGGSGQAGEDTGEGGADGVSEPKVMLAESPADDSGCGCRTAPSRSAPFAWALAPLALLARRRRRAA